jgi:hypothetical protein
VRPDTFLIQIWSDSGTVIEPDHGRNQRHESENMMNMREDRIQVIQGVIAVAGQTT